MMEEKITVYGNDLSPSVAALPNVARAHLVKTSPGLAAAVEMWM
jgi:hypothetical protein